MKPPSRVLGDGSSLYRAIDQHGQVIDVLIGEKRDLAAPVTTDRAPASPLEVQ